mmetsp:Transcript_11039/g.32342  ORF Transcript_11039/g.32342 Transcript_11039/m.32342 type:complete len:178 (-) Transcript_11039:71-604(-)
MIQEASPSAADAETALETFDRAPAPSSGPAGPRPQLVFPPGRGAEAADGERERRQLDGDEELARQLAAQLRLTSPAEHDAAIDEDRLPRVGDRARTGAPDGESELDRHGATDDTTYGVEYHALASDGEEDSFPDPPGTGVMGYAPMICSALVGLFRAGGPWWRKSVVQQDALGTALG